MRRRKPTAHLAHEAEAASELDLLRVSEGALAARVDEQRRRTGHAQPPCLARQLLEQVWDELASAG